MQASSMLPPAGTPTPSPSPAALHPAAWGVHCTRHHAFHQPASPMQPPAPPSTPQVSAHHSVFHVPFNPDNAAFVFLLLAVLCIFHVWQISVCAYRLHQIRRLCQARQTHHTCLPKLFKTWNMPQGVPANSLHLMLKLMKSVPEVAHSLPTYQDC